MATSALQNITHACFGLSYLVAFVLEAFHTRWPRPGLRWGGLTMFLAGWLAHSVFLALHHPSPARAYGALLSVAWLLALYIVYSEFLHKNRPAWTLFLLPVITGLVSLAWLALGQTSAPWEMLSWSSGHRAWGAAHGILLLLAAVSLNLASVASVMYLIQADRLRKKKNPLGGLRMLSLERLERNNRRALNIAFPLLSVGLLLGLVLLRQYHDFLNNFLSLKVLGTVGLWLVFLLLFYLRYAVHVPGKRLAVLTLVAFGMMLTVLIAVHPFVPGEVSP